MCVGVKWENGEPLGGEKFPLLPGANDDRSAGFRTARRDPGDELSATPPNAECGMRSAEFQGRVVRLTTITLTFRIPHSTLRTPHLYGFDDLLRPSVQSFQAVGAHEHPPHLHGLDDGAHGDERRDD